MAVPYWRSEDRGTDRRPVGAGRL